MLIADALVALRYTHIRVKVTETSQVQPSHLKFSVSHLDKVGFVVAILARREAFLRVLKFLPLAVIRLFFRTYLINIRILATDTVVILQTVP